jgi:ABC-type polysaccharide/polyol phosphate transport system ATPase subunit
MADVERICDRVAWLDNHVVKMIGEPKKVVENYLRS